MELFILNGIDYTKNILMSTYKVQSVPVTKTWEDVLYCKHNDLLRWRIEGTFTIYFDDKDEFDSFMTNLINARGEDNYTEATLYDNYNRNQAESRFMFQISLENDLPYYGNKKHGGYEIKVEEQ